MQPHPTTRILPTDTPDLFDAAVLEAAQLLRAGQLVAIPTETVYGLAANALDPDAVARIFATKGRPSHNPIIVHIASLDLARQCTACWPKAADILARSFWPGPLTLVLPKSPAIPPIVTAHGNTVGIRWPSHPFAQAVIRSANLPLAAPSANTSSRTSPTTAQHVLHSLNHRIPLIIDGGTSSVGIESTVLDLTTPTPRILRPGMIHEESLRAVLGNLEAAQPPSAGPLRSPGLLEKHYAPKARLHLLSWTNDSHLRQQLTSLLHPHPPFAATAILTHSHIPSATGFIRVSVIPHDPEAYARALYAELHRCDDAGAAHIIVESVPNTPPWRAIADRLRRAAA